MTSYSQLGQDIDVLKVYNYKKNGFFIEIGANDGVTLSNTYLLEKDYDWRGICVEPLPDKKDKLIANRPKSICIHKAAYNKSGFLLDFVITEKNDLFSGLSNDIVNFSEGVYEKKNTVKIETISLNDILEANNAPRFIEYLSIDTEGSEFEILSELDFNKYIFGLIDVEHNWIEPRRTQIYNLLTANGYTYLRPNKFDDTYIHNFLLTIN
jgi:FkbM family methyltransferase